MRQTTGRLAAVAIESASETPHCPRPAGCSTPCHCRAEWETVKLFDVLGHAGYGYSAFPVLLGIPVLLAVHADRMRVVESLANPRSASTMPLKRCSTIDAFGAHLIRPDCKEENSGLGKLGSTRQRVKSVIDILKNHLILESHDGRSHPGVYSLVVALALVVAGFARNWLRTPNANPLTGFDRRTLLGSLIYSPSRYQRERCEGMIVRLFILTMASLCRLRAPGLAVG